jgi:Ca2+-binding RTX toxin-like protein
MRGGTGDDRYFIFSEGEDAREELNAGTDTVLAGISYTLEANFENLTLLTLTTVGADNDFNGTANAANNVLTGNAGSNVLDGKASNDVLDGLGGNDVLIGGAGNDRYINNRAGDVAFEASAAPAGGNDTVLATVSYAAGFGIENVTLQGW